MSIDTEEKEEADNQHTVPKQLGELKKSDEILVSDTTS